MRTREENDGGSGSDDDETSISFAIGTMVGGEVTNIVSVPWEEGAMTCK